EKAPEDTGGSNIVNTILVDYRAFYTFGELTVLGMAGIAIAVLLATFRFAPVPDTLLDRNSPGFEAFENSIFLRATGRVIGPIIVALSVLLFFRGHYQTGGGFVAALVGAGGMALMYLSAPSNDRAKIRWPYFTLIGSGVALASLT